jgi:outer membrane protein
MRKTYYLAALASAVIAPTAQAETLSEAMAVSLETNPTIEAERARLRAAEEQLPQARSDILPSLSVSASADTSRSEFAGVSADSEGWGASVNASQLLFASGQVAYNVRFARAQVATAAADYVSNVQELLLQVTQAYAFVRETRAGVEARQKTLENLEEQRRFAQARFEAGAATRTDLAQAEARLAQARTQYIQAQGALAAANETYLRVVGRPAGELQPVSAVEGLPPTLEDALQTAVQRSPILEAARAQEVAADASVKLASASRGPRLSLEAGASLSDEFNARNAERNSDSVGLRLSLPLFTGGFTSSRVRQQRALRTAVSLERAAAERAVREQVTTAWTDVATSRSALQAAQEQLAAAELAYRGVRLEQDVGLRATYEALDQENELLAARLAVAAAERDLAIAERQLAASIGALTQPR